MTTRIAVTASETSTDPMQPSRLLKKKNNGCLRWGGGTDVDAVPTSAEAIPGATGMIAGWTHVLRIPGPTS